MIQLNKELLKHNKIKSNLRLLLVIIIPLSMAALLTFYHINQPKALPFPIAQNGEIDLSHWDFTQQGAINLNGDWAFYWDKLYSPAELNALDEASPLKVKVPGYWDDYQLNGNLLPNEGHATYSLTIRGLQKGNYALNIPTTYTANKIWLNNQLVAQSGQVGTNVDNTNTRWRSHDVFFSSDEHSIQLTLQMATYNHPHFDGGITRAITLGTAKDIHITTIQRSLVDWLIVGVFLLLAFYQLVVYWQRRQDHVPLYFTLVSVLIALGAVLTRNSFLNLDIFSIDFSIYQRIIYVCQSFIGILFLKYIQGFYPQYCRKKIVDGLLYLSLTYFITMQLLTPYEPLIARHIFSVIMGATICYGLFCITMAAIHREKSADVFLLGILFITLSFIYELLIANDIVHPLKTNKDGPAAIALLMFVMSQTFILARRHSDTLFESQFYQQVNNEKSRFISAASHDLRQPLYALQLMSKILSEPPMKGEFSRIATSIGDSTRQMEELVNSLLDISKMDQQGIKLQHQTICMNEFLTSLENKYRYEAEAKFIKLKVKSTNLKGLSDHRLLSRIVGNLLNNAIRYTDSGCVFLGCRRTSSTIRICVIDTGPGVAVEQQDMIFQEFYQVKKDENSSQGLGLGLAIVKRLSNALNHKLSLTSKENHGSLFSIEIPRVQ